MVYLGMYVGSSWVCQNCAMWHWEVFRQSSKQGYVRWNLRVWGFDGVFWDVRSGWVCRNAECNMENSFFLAGKIQYRDMCATTQIRQISKTNACQHVQKWEHSSSSCTWGPVRNQRISFWYHWCWCVFAMFGSKCRILENCNDDSVAWCIMMFNRFGAHLIPNFASFLSEMLGWKPVWE